MHLFVQIITVICVDISTSYCFDYCSIKECPNGEHTMCKYKHKQQGACDNQKAGMNKPMIVAILHRHNELRAMVARGEVSGQPSASNMMKLKWNSEMATIAQRWVNQCIEGQDKCRHTEDRTMIGQNVVRNFVKSRDTEEDKDIEAGVKAVDAWFSEVNFTKNAQIDSYSGFVSRTFIGHYSQMVWATTTEVGCGYVEIKTTSDVYQPFRMACNYKPTGNVMSSPIYKKGKPCSECPSGTTCSNKYDGLCTENDEDGILDGRGSSICMNFTFCMVISTLALQWLFFNTFE